MPPSKVNYPLLGWIPFEERTQEQNDAHEAAVRRMTTFALKDPTAGPVKIILTDSWRHPDVVADIGREFTGFRQLTGSCCGASGGNAEATLGFLQRIMATNPTKAFIPWWPYTYGRTRYNEGDRGQGEGAVVSIWGKTAQQEGSFGIDEIEGEPVYDAQDGLALSQHVEYQWSDGGRGPAAQCVELGKKHTIGGVAPLQDPAGIKTAIVSGYPVHTGHPLYVGHGRVVERPGGAYVSGHFDGRGGHATCFLAYWDHPDDGPLFGYSNQWDATTYERDPAGLARCMVWVPEHEVETMFGRFGSEVQAYSHLNYFPAQPRILDFSTI